MSEQNQFDWVDFYKELSGKLLQYKDNREELIEKVRKIYEITGINLPTLEKDNQIIDIDPFTFFGLFNKKLTDANRLSILKAIAELFDVKAPVPTAFDSIPVLNPQNATFYYFIPDRGDDDIQDLWELFDAALAYAKDPSPETIAKVSKYFDLCINKKGNGNSKITMGVYWIAPNALLNLDQRNTWYIYESGKIPEGLVSESDPFKDVFKTTTWIHEPITDVAEQYLPSITIATDYSFKLIENCYAGMGQYQGYCQKTDDGWACDVTDASKMQGFKGDDVKLIKFIEGKDGSLILKTELCMSREGDVFKTK